VKVEVSGQADLRKLAAKIRKAQRELPKALDRGMLDAGGLIEKEIRKSTDTYMPKGYEQTFKRSLIISVKLTNRGGLREVTLTGRAFGRRGHDRQVDQLERGRLKHPFWGRWVNSPKAWQRIRKGWFSEPAHKATPRAVAAVERQVKRLTDEAN
jgi:hypothetical protein